jgi:Na+(H+)/acetate symporter ActP
VAGSLLSGLCGCLFPLLLLLFWEACSLLGALLGSVVVLALCSLLFSMLFVPT